MRFAEAYGGWQDRLLTQGEAAQLLVMSERDFRRYVGRYKADGLNGLIDLRIEQVLRRRAPVDEVMRLVDLYQSRHDGWNVRHFHARYRKDQVGTRSYSLVKNALQKANAVPRAKGKHRRKRERRPLPGMTLRRDGSRHGWVGQEQWDLIATMDDATGEHTCIFFVEEEGTLSSLLGMGQTIAAKGLFCSLYSDRGSHYFHRPGAGGKVDKDNPTQVGRALAQLGIEHIAAYSKDRRSNGLSGRMADAGCSRQSPILSRHASRFPLNRTPSTA